MLPFSGMVPNVSEHHVRCNGKLAGVGLVCTPSFLLLVAEELHIVVANKFYEVFQNLFVPRRTVRIEQIEADFLELVSAARSYRAFLGEPSLRTKATHYLEVEPAV